MQRKLSFLKKSHIIIIVLSVYILCLSFGYAFFSESLSINGVASTIDYYSGKKLPLNAIKRDEKANTYYTSNYDDGYSYSSSSFGYINALVSEKWEDDTYIIVLDKGMLGGFQGKTISYTVSFSNATSLDYTEGKTIVTSGNVLLNNNVSLAAGTSTDISNATASIDKTILGPDEVVNVTLNITIDTINMAADSVAKAKVSYKLYDGSNGDRYFNFIVKYDSAVEFVNLFNEEDMLTGYYSASNVTKVNNGYEVVGYPVTIIGQMQSYAGDKIITDLKQNLEAGTTYRLITGYSGTINGVSGSVRIRDKNTALVSSPYNNGGIRFIDFSLTQEQIDSIDRIYVYGAGAGQESNLFNFIRIIKISD